MHARIHTYMPETMCNSDLHIEMWIIAVPVGYMAIYIYIYHYQHTQQINANQTYSNEDGKQCISDFVPATKTQLKPLLSDMPMASIPPVPANVYSLSPQLSVIHQYLEVS